MKKLLLFIIVTFMFSVQMFSRGYFYDVVKRQLFNKQNEEVHYEWFNEYKEEEDIRKFYMPKHDKKTGEAYFYCCDMDYKNYELFVVNNNELDKENKFRVILEKGANLRHIENKKAFFSTHNQSDILEYYIIDLQISSTKKISIRDVHEDYLVYALDFKDDKIFFKTFYYDIEKGAKIKYPINLDMICVDEAGKRIVGLDEKNYITIIDLETNQINKTKIKRSFKSIIQYKNTGLYYLEENTLYYTKRKPNFWYYLESLLGSYAIEKRQWYKFDLKSGKKSKIDQPSDYVDMI